MKFRKAWTAAGTLLAAAAALTMNAGSAYAIDWDHTASYDGVTVYYEEHGDIVKVCDSKKNGRSASVIVYENSPGDVGYSMTVSSGYGDCKSHRASDGARYNPLEGHYVYFQLDPHTGNYYTVKWLNDH
ncbi:hypothetical protein ACFYWD_21975 [Streptomyces sp. NPDC003781]|uniref:hypothetical protein n=1 Tax=Streptomyces sp. NPDC003781 TaxID=3364686 RepID=UPI0036CE44ED